MPMPMKGMTSFYANMNMIFTGTVSSVLQKLMMMMMKRMMMLRVIMIGNVAKTQTPIQKNKLSLKKRAQRIYWLNHLELMSWLQIHIRGVLWTSKNWNEANP